MKNKPEKIKKIINVISEKTKLNPKLLPVIALLVAGVFMLMISELSDKEKEIPAQAATTVYENSYEYEKKLEERLMSIISSIEGAGETRVMVTLESGSEDVYLNNSDYGENIEADGENSFEKKDDYIIVDNPSGQGGIVVRRTEPKVRGVAVVCRGAGSDTVRAQIVETVTALLDISSARVSVAKMN